jgi:hypothetical protein
MVNVIDELHDFLKTSKADGYRSRPTEEMLYYFHDPMSFLDCIVDREHIKDGVRKPRINIWCELSSKDNFSVCWCPKFVTVKSYSVVEYDNTDYLDTVNWSPFKKEYRRPDDELIFIHGVRSFRVDDDFDSKIVGDAVVFLYKHIIKTLSSTCDVTVKNNVKLIPRDSGWYFLNVGPTGRVDD